MKNGGVIVTWEQFLTIFLTAIITAGATNIFGYWKEKRISSSKYAEEVLKRLYVPIYKILVEGVIPGDGYQGIDEDQLDRIKSIIDDNPELTDPKLDALIYGYLEDAYWNLNRLYVDQKNPEYVIYDSDRKLLDYILISFNKTRKSLGLPHDRTYAFPILIKLKKWREKVWYIKKLRKLKKKQKKSSTSQLEDTE